MSEEQPEEQMESDSEDLFSRECGGGTDGFGISRGTRRRHR